MLWRWQTLELTLAMTLVAYALLSSHSTHVHFAPSIRIDVAHLPSMVTWANQRQILMWEAGLGGEGRGFVQHRSLESIRSVGHMGIN
jgi:hypothetical protein